MTVGVIVRNEAATLVETLEALLRQDYASAAFEIIVVDGRSTDGTYALAKGCEEKVPDRIRVVLETTPTSHGNARNLVLRHARPDVRYFAFTDADCTVPSDWLRTLVNTLEAAAPDVVGCGGPRCAHPKDSGLAYAMSHYLADPLATGFNPGYAARNVKYTRGPSNYNAAYRGDVLKRFAYDANIRVGEDLDLNYRIRRTGLRFVQVSTAVAHHGSRSLKELSAQMFGYGRAKAAFWLRYRRIDRFKSVVAPGLVLVMALSPALALFPGMNRSVIVLYTTYASVVLCVTASVTWRMQSAWGLCCLPAVVLTHFSYGIGFLVEACKRRCVACV